MTNDLAQNSMEAAEKEIGPIVEAVAFVIRWKVEQFHREDKGITSIESCQCRLQRSQRNRIAAVMMVWTEFKKLAYNTKRTNYLIKQSLLDEYIRKKLKNPTIAFA